MPETLPAQLIRRHGLSGWLRLRGKELLNAYRRFQEDDGTLMAAAVAYYLGLSLFPLLLVLISALGWLMEATEFGRSAEQQVLNTVGEHASPEVGEYVRQMLSQVQDKSAIGGRIGLLGVLFIAIAAFVQFERAFDRMWDMPPRERKGLVAGLKLVLWERGVAFLMLLVLAALVLAVFIAGLVVSGIGRYSTEVWSGFGEAVPMLRFLATLILNAGLMTLLYRWLPRKPVSWKAAFRGGLFAAAAWELGRAGLATFVIGQKYTSAYGVVGAFIAILLWCYYAVIVIFLGAEYLQATSGVQRSSEHRPVT